MQVYCNNRYVGNFNYPVPDGCRQFKVAKFDNDVDLFLDEGAMLTTAVTKEFVFTIKPRGVEIPLDGMTVMRGEVDTYLDYAKRSYNIPDNALVDKRQDPFRDGETIRYRWDALDLDQEVYEELFDHPAFEPV